MACGTPVLAFRCGSVPEIIENGITGRIVDNEAEAIAALPGILSCDRRTIRQRFEKQFTAARMAQDYVGVYRRLIMRASDDELQNSWPRRLDLDSGNDLTYVSPGRLLAAAE
jgi:hypothetical protein